MKRVTLLITALLAVGTVQAQMQAVFSFGTYYRQAENQPYVETSLLFDAWTMQFVRMPEGGYRATAEVTMVVRQQDSVCFVKKYDLHSPVLQSLDSLDFNILDVQRFSLPNGIYDLDIVLRDKNTEAQPSSASEKLVINYDRQKPILSTVQMLSKVTPTVNTNILSRGGYDMEPYIDDYVPEKVEDLKYYCEVYNIDREVGDDPFVAVAYIENQETGTRLPDMQKSVRKKSASTVPLIGSLDIRSLPSGNYNLVVELRNREGQSMLYKKVPFFRSNPSVKPRDVSDFATTFAGRYTDEEELNLYLDALYPIASDMERRAAQDAIRRPDLEAKQAFLYEFWMRRNALTPETDWLKYKERIDYVQEHFSYPKTRGIMTDRGRVYLQYGPPDYVRDEKNFAVVSHAKTKIQSSGDLTAIGNMPEQESNLTDQAFYLPYQLWRYNMIPGDDPNRVFIFWDQFRSGYYSLLQSNAKGEVQEYGWERRLSHMELPEGVEGPVGVQFRRGY